MDVEELTREALADATGAQVRQAIRTGRWRGRIGMGDDACHQ